MYRCKLYTVHCGCKAKDFFYAANIFCIDCIDKPFLWRADPTAVTAKNPKLPERWAYENNHVGVLVELAKVKEVDPEIMSSSLGELVQKEEERECRRRKEEEEREWRRKMLEQCTSAIQQQQDWQMEVVGMFDIFETLIFDRWWECWSNRTNWFLFLQETHQRQSRSKTTMPTYLIHLFSFIKNTPYHKKENLLDK